MPDWLAWLRLRHRALGTQHADLVQQAAADLLHWLDKRPAMRDVSDEDLRRVGFRILQRRVADAFRSAVGEWARQPADGDAAEDVPDARAEANPDVALQYSRLLRAVLGLLSELSPQDRALLVGEEWGTSPDGPMTPGQRQRLHRLREHMRDALRVRFGLDVGLLSRGEE